MPRPATKDDVDKVTKDILSDIDSRNPITQTQRTPASFNPDFAVVGDYHASLSTNNQNPARNRFDIGSVELVDMSNGITLKEVPTGHVGRDQGDIHGYGNPHYTLNPQIARRMAVTLVKSMMNADPANADFYKANAKKFVLSMADVSKEIKEKFKPYAGLKVVSFHKAWEYFADAVPIDIVGAIEEKVGITPSAAYVKKVIDMMKQQGVKVVICETYDDNKLAQYVADQAGAKMVILPDHVLGVPDAKTYEDLFQYDTDKLIETAKEAGVEPKAP